MANRNIQSFNTIRSVMAHIYNYGFYTREDYPEQDVVGRLSAYDKIIGQLRALYFTNFSENEILEEDTEGRGKYKCYKFRRDHFSQTGEQLAATFGLSSISERGILSTIRCLSSSFASKGTLAIEVDKKFFSDEDLSYSSIYRRLKDLAKNGYIILNNQKRYVANTIPKLDELNENELTQLYILASFYAGTGFPRIPFLFLQKSLRRHLFHKLCGKCEISPDILPDVFIFRDNACGNILDETIVYELLKCCQSHRLTTIHHKRHGKEVKSITIAPVELKVDTKLGRWYLLALRDSKPAIFRVTFIRKVIPLKTTFDYDRTREKVLSAFQFNRFSALPCPDLKPIHVEAELHFDIPAIRIQFEREIISGKIERRGDKEFYCVDVSDVSEIKPFLRSYGAYIKILPSDRHSLDTDLQSEYERMLSAYGTV